MVLAIEKNGMRRKADALLGFHWYNCVNEIE
jgi:hypothetical protein